MSTNYCPFCYEEMAAVSVVPCFDCGIDAERISVLKQDVAENYQHDSINYMIYRIFEDIEVTLCDFCAVDLGSYHKEFFGIPREVAFGYEKLQFLEQVAKPSLGKDKYCESCGFRLAFINFVLKVRNKFNG